MIVFWIILGLLLVLISALFAYLSMKDLRETPEDFGSKNGLFLIRNSSGLTPEVFLTLHQKIEKKGEILSLERLFKGSKSALCVFGPKKVLEYLKILDLLELEDYSNSVVEAKVLSEVATAWEMGWSKKLKMESLFSQFPRLEEETQLWYQIVLKPQRGKRGFFRGQIRVAVISSDSKRRKKLASALQTQKGGLTKIHQAFSSSQIMDFYNKRSISLGNAIKISSDEIVRLWALPQSVS